MHALKLKPTLNVYVPPSPVLGDNALQIINHLRLVALQCRSQARLDLNQACALLLANPADAQLRHAETLMRGYRQAVSQRPVFFRPGAEELSFDEAWLGRLFEAVENRDDDSFSFLIKSRVPRWTQRNFAYLIRSISEQFHRN